MILLLGAVLALGGAALLSSLASRHDRWARSAVIAGLAAAAIAGGTLAWRTIAGQRVSDLLWSWPVPGAAFHVGMDSLSACFLLLVLVVGCCAGLYGEGYLAGSHGHIPATPVRFFFLVLLGAMALLVAARNAFLFMIAWETMALAAFGLVSCEHGKPEVRKAGLLYLICTHVGSLFLLALFALLGRNAGSLEFSAFAAAPALSAAERVAVFLLALVGFGMKAGFMPLHIWLQEAHPAAPSHASAAMSGVMIEMGLYGLLRLLSLLGPVSIEAAFFLVALGLITAVFGITFAMAQRDFKRLLAYSSIENIGIILTGAGLGCYGLAKHHPSLALLGFAGAILHTLNHGLFKSLLFLSAGAVYQAVGTRDIEACGGLQKRLPWTCGLTAVGAAAICGLPPLNGFTGEWLIYNWLLRPDPGHGMLFSALAAAALALVGAFAVAAFSKYYGLTCLGQPRSEAARDAREPSWIMLGPMALLAALCVGIGLFPSPALHVAFAAAGDVAGQARPAVSASLDEWSRLLGAIGLLGAGVCALSALLWLFRGALLRRRKVGLGPTWSCGFTAPTARMQYTGSSYPMPLTRVFAAALATREEIRPPLGYWPVKASFESRTPDPALERWLPVLTAKFEEWLSAPRRLQYGRLQLYLLYVSAFLVITLLWKL
jgi:formate hydrogenlyase subunit 3/multisubunit Na+/H+ antiporter MnhD subunit